MPPRRVQGFIDDLDAHSRLHARWTTERDVVRYAVLLLVLIDDIWRPVVLFDCSHDERNDRHDYTRRGIKGPAVIFHHGSPGEAMRIAIGLIRDHHQRMIGSWRP